MIHVGIVGHEAKKFTPETEARARLVIRGLLQPLVGDFLNAVVSGRSPLGGIDVWAEEEAGALGIATLIFPPRTNHWATGYKIRNLQIAEASDIVHCIVVRDLPPGYTGMRFPQCYHCLKGGCTYPHVKSGGCWTALKCKQRMWHVIA